MGNGGNFRLVKIPFTQLYSIHTVVRSGGEIKQVPLAYMVKFGPTKSNYKCVFTALLGQLPSEPAVKIITGDFEYAVWQILRVLLPEVNVSGCSFHINPAVWRKMQELGLQTEYYKNGPTYNFCKRLMVLTFLPVEYIPTQFAAIETSGLPPTTSHHLTDLTTLSPTSHH